ncbi:aa3-type cytochrome c oxidase subunit IV [Aurantiacibacter sp. MUD61]|nr:aa3-type cytochrome c oxidase subunit IV [Aurantiacibacter sp. MUD61]
MSNPHDMKAAKGTYASFISMTKWSIPVIAIIVFIVVLLIS